MKTIRLVGISFVDSGNMKPGYIDSMLLREKVANTYLGNGIAIPHRLPKDRDLSCAYRHCRGANSGRRASGIRAKRSTWWWALPRAPTSISSCWPT